MMIDDKTLTVMVAIANERERQMKVEGWTREHDLAELNNSDLQRAAACYAMWAADCRGVARQYWPWADEYFKPKDTRADLIRAAALIVAALERMDAIDEGLRDQQPQVVKGDVVYESQVLSGCAVRAAIQAEAPKTTQWDKLRAFLMGDANLHDWKLEGAQEIGSYRLTMDCTPNTDRAVITKFIKNEMPPIYKFYLKFIGGEPMPGRVVSIASQANEALETQRKQFMAAIDFALELDGGHSMTAEFLSDWRKGDVTNWPEFKG